MISGRLRVLGVCILLLAPACDATGETVDSVQALVPSSSSTTTSTVPEPWATEAQLFMDALHRADARGGAYLGEFYTDSAVFENRVAELYLEGRDAISRYPVSLGGSPSVPQLLFLTIDQAATLTDIDPESGLFSFTDLGLFSMRDGRIQHEVRLHSAAHLARWGYMSKDRSDRLSALYEEYLTAWDSGEGERIEAVYRAGATRRDGLFGGSWAVGEDWADSLPPHLSVSADEVRYQSVFAAYVSVETKMRAGVFTEPTRDDPTRAHALFDLTEDGGCQLRLLAAWELDDYLITGEEIFYEVESLRLCAPAFGLEPLPEGWWTGLQLLDEFFEEPTAQVTTTAGTTITILNGGRRQIELVEWGLQRFEQAGLTAPIPDVLAFPPSRWCARGAGDYTGLAVFDNHQTRIDMCLLEGEVCIGPTCDTMRAEARLHILHELAHVWERQNVEQTTREAFLVQRDLEVWSDPSGALATSEQGIEQAADMIAWGLLDEDLPMIRIPGVTPEQLEAGFRLLTDSDPIVGR